MKKHFSSDYKAKVALEALKGAKSPAEIASTYSVHATQVGFWKNRLLEGASTLFSGKRNNEKEDTEKLIGELYKIIGQRDTELEWMKKNMQQLST
jgi:transposase-like protein